MDNFVADTSPSPGPQRKEGTLQQVYSLFSQISSSVGTLEKFGHYISISYILRRKLI